MAEPPFSLPDYFDYGATFLWAFSGSYLAARKGYDIAGVLAIAYISSTGGGLLRDGLFIQTASPALLRDPWLILVATAGALAMILLGRPILHSSIYQSTLTVSDGVGLGAYAVFGLQLAQAAGFGPAGAVLVGVVNAVGGSLLRDVLMRQEPELFRPGRLTALAAVVGCLAFLLFRDVGRMPLALSAWLAILLVFTVRMASVRFNWHTRPVRLVGEPRSQSERGESD